MKIESIAEKEDHQDYLDGLRGLAVLLVIFHHVIFYVKEPFEYQGLYLFIDRGAFGVSLFFLVSAFTLSSSWTRRSKEEKGPKRKFFIRRAFRILPFWWANVFFNYLRAPKGIVQLISSLTLTQGLFSKTFSWLIVPYGWSLSVEETFYVLFPVWAKLLRSLWKLIFALVISMGLSLAWENLAPLYFGIVQNHEFYFGFPVSRYYVFFVGMILFALTKDYGLKERVGRITDSKFPWMEILIVYLNYQFDHHFQQVLICVLLFLASSTVNTLTGKLVRLKWMRHLGILCFSMYLLHHHVIKVLMSHLNSILDYFPQSGEFRWVLISVLVIICSYGVSLVTYNLIEYPSVLLGRRILDKQVSSSREPVHLSAPSIQ